jgi:hypothetical protein
MKLTNLTIIAFIAALTAFAGPTRNLPEAQVSAIQHAFVGIRAPELAAKAAEIVARAKNEDKTLVAVATVRIVVSKRPASAPAVVSAISKAAPQASAEVAAEASKIAPDQSAEIAKAAAAAAPEHAEKIAAAVSEVTPKAALQITRAVVTAVPLASLKVVESVVAVVPAAAPQLERDQTIARVTRSAAAAAHHGGAHGTATSLPGTIAGDPRPTTPTAVVTATPGVDPNRYNTP